MAEHCSDSDLTCKTAPGHPGLSGSLAGMEIQIDLMSLPFSKQSHNVWCVLGLASKHPAGTKKSSQLKNNGHILLKNSYTCYHTKTLRHCRYNGESTGDVSMPNPHTTAERVYQVLGFHLSLLEVLHIPKKAAAEEEGGGIFRSISQCSVCQKGPLHWQLCLLIFPDIFFEESGSQWPKQKRGTSAGTQTEEGHSGSFSSCWAHCSLSFLVYIFLITW